MEMPKYEQIMRPLLEYSTDELEHSFGEAVDYLTEKFQLSETDRNKKTSNGKQSLFRNRVGWAKTYLTNAKLLVSTKRGFFQITEKGVEIAKSGSQIDKQFLQQFKGFNEFLSQQKKMINNNEESSRELNKISQSNNDNVSLQMNIKQIIQYMKKEYPDQVTDLSEYIELTLATLDDVIHNINKDISLYASNRQFEDISIHASMASEIVKLETEINKILLVLNSKSQMNNDGVK